jgi:hypothetical protein
LCRERIDGRFELLHLGVLLQEFIEQHCVHRFAANSLGLAFLYPA